MLSKTNASLKTDNRTLKKKLIPIKEAANEYGSASDEKTEVAKYISLRQAVSDTLNDSNNWIAVGVANMPRDLLWGWSTWKGLNFNFEITELADYSRSSQQMGQVAISAYFMLPVGAISAVYYLYQGKRKKAAFVLIAGLSALSVIIPWDFGQDNCAIAWSSDGTGLGYVPQLSSAICAGAFEGPGQYIVTTFLTRRLLTSIELTGRKYYIDLAVNFLFSFFPGFFPGAMWQVTYELAVILADLMEMSHTDGALLAGFMIMAVVALCNVNHAILTAYCTPRIIDWVDSRMNRICGVRNFDDAEQEEEADPDNIMVEYEPDAATLIAVANHSSAHPIHSSLKDKSDEEPLDEEYALINTFMPN